MNKRQAKAMFNQAQQAIHDQRRQKSAGTKLVMLAAAAGPLTGQSRPRAHRQKGVPLYGLTGKFFVIVEGSDFAARRSPDMEKAEAEKIYALVVDETTVTDLEGMGFERD